MRSILMEMRLRVSDEFIASSARLKLDGGSASDAIEQSGDIPRAPI
jgi:hypothetical protein